MALNESPSSLVVDASELRQLWENGQHPRALRGALDSWHHLLRDGQDLHWLERALRASGLTAEAFAVQARMTRAQGSDAAAWEALVRSVLHSGDPWWASGLLEEAGGRSRELQALRIEVQLALGDAAGLISAWLHDHQDEAALDAAVDWWVRCGRVDEAERVLNDVTGVDVWRARLALWRKQPAVARALLGRLSQSPEVRCLEAVAMALEGRLADAEALLRSLTDGEARADAWTWLATVLRKQRRYAEAVQAADIASLASPTFNLATRLEHELSDIYLRAGAGHGRSSPTTWLRQSIGLRIRPIRRLENAAALYALGARPEDPIGTLAAILERFGGNHTPHLTTANGGTLVSCRLPTDPRHLGASIQRVLFTRGPEAARALFEELAPRVSAHPLFRIYHGELELWLGAYEDAARVFRAALTRDRRVRWAWIGLGASAMLQGDLREAQRIWSRSRSLSDRLTGFAGPTLYVYRGECYRRQGEIERARRDLHIALRHKPQRLSARINLALIDGDAESLYAAHRECVALAPILMSELSGSRAQQLEQMLDAMRGNRSSSASLVSYHLWGRVWRLAT
jgi:tetratricopeptide (TPR) repeat protein